VIWLGLLLVVLLCGLTGFVWLRKRHLVITVEGPSMLPAYRHGDMVLVRRRSGHRVRTGQVVVADLPDEVRPIPAGVSEAEALLNRRVIKRVAAIAGAETPLPVKAFGYLVPGGSLVLLGDNPDGSGDSRLYGFVPVSAVVGVVVRRLSTLSPQARPTAARAPDGYGPGGRDTSGPGVSRHGINGHGV
jgi:signal peptidase I